MNRDERGHPGMTLRRTIFQRVQGRMRASGLQICPGSILRVFLCVDITGVKPARETGGTARVPTHFLYDTLSGREAGTGIPLCGTTTPTRSDIARVNSG